MIETLLSTNATGSKGIALDISQGHMYWTTNTDQIRRANLDGTNVQTIIANTGFGARGIALDVNASSLFWTTVGENAIHSSDLNGAGSHIIVSSGLSGPQGIAVLPIPEPSTLVLFAAAALIWVVRRLAR
jgi:hypothetical protein